jgi:AcrR family transcriptional regulator
MPLKSDATRKRILHAAEQEFAKYGISGARVDRIALAAEANKERIYAYFGDKRSLFDLVVDAALNRAAETVPTDFDDLPGGVGALFDLAFSEPDLLRLLAWARLEGDGAPAVDDPRVAAHLRIAEEFADAQSSGRVDSSWDPVDLMLMLSALGRAWAEASPELQAIAGSDGPSGARHRDAMVEAARRIVTPR